MLESTIAATTTTTTWATKFCCWIHETIELARVCQPTTIEHLSSFLLFIFMNVPKYQSTTVGFYLVTILAALLRTATEVGLFSAHDRHTSGPSFELPTLMQCVRSFSTFSYRSWFEFYTHLSSCW